MKTLFPAPDSPSAPSPAVPFTRERSSSLRAESPANGWIPPSWQSQLAGLIFLPRMLAKGRKVLEGQRRGQNLMNGFLFGDFDYADRRMLKFLRAKETRVLELLRQSTDDTEVALALVRESGRSAAEIPRWNKRFRTINAPFLAMWDADEGRREPGLGTTSLRVLYNYGLMPPVYLYFRLAQRLTSSVIRKYN